MEEIKAIVQSYRKDTGKAVMQSCISFTKLKDIARFTARTKSEYDPYDDLKDIKDQEYQRELNYSHVKEIVEYIKQSIAKEDSISLALFPTSMLIAFNNEEQLDLDPNNITSISLPDTCYIVDGQHRLKAMMTLFDEIKRNNGDPKILKSLEDFKFNCTILLNFDIWEQARVFADVNFKQKKVNKSLYYDIYGSIPPETISDYKQNGVYIAHSLVEQLNKTQSSPLFKAIKMLGCGEGVISQAFLVESLLMHISSPRGIWYFNNLNLSEDEYLKYIKTELFSYLKIVTTTFKNIWLNPNYIMHKTTGIGAIMRLMGYLHNKIANEMPIGQKLDLEFLYNKYESTISIYINKLVQEGSELFQRANYGNTGGKGLETQLYKAMTRIIDPPKDDN